MRKMERKGKRKTKEVEEVGIGGRKDENQVKTQLANLGKRKRREAKAEVNSPEIFVCVLTDANNEGTMMEQ